MVDNNNIDGVFNLDFGEEQEPIFIDSSDKRKITKPKIIVGAIFTLGLAAYIASQKFNVQLPKVPKISIVNDVDDSDSNVPFFKINPGSNSDHQDETKEGKDDEVR